MFVLDSSASEGRSNFQKQVDFVRDVAYQFSIGPQNVQVWSVYFDGFVVLIFKYDGKKISLMGARRGVD